MHEEREPNREHDRTVDESAPDRSDAKSGDRRDAMSEQCSQCGNPVLTDEWHPVATERDDDGRFVIHDFCSEGCRSAWQTEASN